MENQLDYLDEFRELLKHYKVSEAGKKVLKETNLVLLVAPTASGRNTIVTELLKTGDYHYVVSDTTRQPRVNNGVREQNGKEYWFRPEDVVLADLKAGKYLEAAIIHNQQVSGISMREIVQAHKEGKVALTDIEVIGTATIMAAKPDTHALFVMPPSFEEWMRRIESRGAMTVAEKQRRLTSAAKEFEVALSHDYYRFVLNDSVADAAKQIEALTRGEEDSVWQTKLRTTAKKLLSATENWLSHNP
jgi:guanylate kinase